ncbi:hypothetical protein B0I35DRAFT_276721 [Stachybotrys elegans]|uniref:Uncharacterized protein n=1 Tax=Stachybotrys elegans TaxID=80388 RepID=A0A8K0WP46_9HYPO|nr:hypothetical protein B0I35DRAFT_276721 [Stachybotrys elegans]
MSLNKILLIAGAAAVAMAAEPLAERDLESCMSAVQGAAAIIADMPTPEPAVQTALASLAATASVTACEIPAVTGAAGEGLTSYISGLVSFYAANSDSLNAIISECNDVPEIQSQLAAVPTDLVACTSLSFAEVTGSPEPESDETSGTASPTSTNPPPAETPNAAAPRATGVAMAAVAMAGLFAAQAM